MKALDDVFARLSHGQIDDALLEMVTPDHGEAHDRHVEAIHDEVEDWNEDHVLGQPILTRDGVYRPHVGSSTLFLLRALLTESLPQPAGRVLEIGAGSGALSIGLLLQAHAGSALLTDIHPAAVDVARENIVRAGLTSQAKVQHSDMFAAIPATERADRILFNAPLWHRMEGSDQELALVDPGGTLMRTFLDEADRFLAPAGELWFTYSNLSRPEILNDYADKWAFTLALAEFSPQGGIWRFAYRARLHQH